MTFCNIECWKYTFSLWNIDILAPQMHAGRPAGGSPETVPTGTQQSAKNSINPCTKWGGTFRHPINPCIICTFLTPECKKCYKSLHETHPELSEQPPGTTMDISFSLRQDPLEQALFGKLAGLAFRPALKELRRASAQAYACCVCKVMFISFVFMCFNMLRI